MTYAGTAAWLRPQLWTGWVVGGVVWVVWVVSLALGGWSRDVEGQLFGADHLAFYSAARMIRDGRQAEVYDHPALFNLQQEIVGGNWNGFMAYRNPPFYAGLYLPTVGLPLPVSALTWAAVSIAALVLAVRCLRPACPWRVVAWSFAFYPFFAAISFGQNTPLSLAIFAVVYRLLSDRRPFAAGLAAGLLWYKPQLLLGLFVWWASVPRQAARCWAGLIVTGGALAALSWLLLPGASRAFVTTLTANIGYGGENGFNKHSPRAFWTLLLPGADPAAIWALTGTCSLAAIGGAVWAARRSGSPVATMFPIAIFLSLWVSPHSLTYEWALLIPAAVVLWECYPSRRARWLCLFALAWTALTVSTALAFIQTRPLNLPVVVQVSVPVLAVVGWLTFRELGQARSEGGGSDWANEPPGVGVPGAVVVKD